MNEHDQAIMALATDFEQEQLPVLGGILEEHDGDVLAALHAVPTSLLLELRAMANEFEAHFQYADLASTGQLDSLAQRVRDNLPLIDGELARRGAAPMSGEKKLLIGVGLMAAVGFGLILLTKKGRRG